MPRMDITEMAFARVYPLLVTKAEKKGRTRDEVDQVTAWLTGYTPEELAGLAQSDTSYGDFFRNAPRYESGPSADHRQDLRHPGGGDRGPAHAGHPVSR